LGEGRASIAAPHEAGSAAGRENGEGPARTARDAQYGSGRLAPASRILARNCPILASWAVLAVLAVSPLATARSPPPSPSSQARRGWCRGRHRVSRSVRPQRLEPLDRVDDLASRNGRHRDDYRPLSLRPRLPEPLRRGLALQ